MRKIFIGAVVIGMFCIVHIAHAEHFFNATAKSVKIKILNHEKQECNEFSLRPYELKHVDLSKHKKNGVYIRAKQTRSQLLEALDNEDNEADVIEQRESENDFNELEDRVILADEEAALVVARSKHIEDEDTDKCSSKPSFCKPKPHCKPSHHDGCQCFVEIKVPCNKMNSHNEFVILQKESCELKIKIITRSLEN